jgi:hypothetical protein
VKKKSALKAALCACKEKAALGSQEDIKHGVMVLPRCDRSVWVPAVDIALVFAQCLFGPAAYAISPDGRLADHCKNHDVTSKYWEQKSDVDVRRLAGLGAAICCKGEKQQSPA